MGLLDEDLSTFHCCRRHKIVLKHSWEQYTARCKRNTLLCLNGQQWLGERAKSYVIPRTYIYPVLFDMAAVNLHIWSTSPPSANWGHTLSWWQDSFNKEKIKLIGHILINVALIFERVTCSIHVDIKFHSVFSYLLLRAARGKISIK